MASLVIVESEEKEKSLRDQSGGSYEALLLRTMPMKISHNQGAPKLYAGEAGFQFVPADAAKQFVATLLANLHKDIYLALDSDQRGEMWSWMLGGFLFSITKGQKSVRRVHVAGFAAQELGISFQRVEPVDAAKAAALYIRSLFNSCLVRHISRLIGTASGPESLPLNFSSLTPLFLLAERETEIAALAVPAKWQVKLRLSGAGGDFLARLQEAYEISDDGFFRDSVEVKKAIALCDGQPCKVKNITATEFVIEPPAPYRLVDLLHDGHVLLGMGPVEVLRAVQKFYYGAEMAGRHVGLVTNPFADLSRETRETLGRIRKEVAAAYGQNFLVERPVEGAVLLPLAPGVAGADLPETFSAEEKNLYELIRTRALAGQMPAAEGKNVSVKCEAGGCLFVGRGPVVAEKGFLRCCQAGYDPDLLQKSPLAALAEGQAIQVEQVIPEQTATVAAEYYTFESLFEDLADFSLAAEPSMISMVQQMLDKGYLTLDANGGLRLRDNAGKVISILQRAFPAMKGINLSAYFEQTVAEAVSGRKALDFALKQFDQNFVMHGVPLVKMQIPKTVSLPQKRSKNIIKSPETAAPEERLQVTPAAPIEPEDAAPAEVALEASQEAVAEELGETVEAAAGAVAEIAGEAEKEIAVAASAWETDQEEPRAVSGAADMAAEEAKEQEALETAGDDEAAIAMAEEGEQAPLPPAEEKMEVKQAPAEEAMAPEAPPQDAAGEAAEKKNCPVCGRLLLVKSDAFGKYWACSGFPACRHSEAFGGEEQEVAMLCPVCGKEPVVVKRTPTGKKLYVCSAQGCEFMAWSQPHAIDCPSCGSLFLVEKKDVSGKTVLRCPRAGCSYFEPLEGETEEENGASDEGAPRKKKILVRRRTGASAGGVKKKVVVRRVKR